MRLESPLPENLEELIRKVIGAAIEVHRVLGPGFLEKIYEHALCFELERNGIAFERQKDVVVPYKEIRIPGQRLDLLVEKELIVEIKAASDVPPIAEAVMLSYLRSLSLNAGLILNFKTLLMKDGIRRYVR